MWLAACLWARKGVDMGWGEDSIFRTEAPRWRDRGLSKCLDILELLVGPGDGSTVGDPCLLARGSGLG